MRSLSTENEDGVEVVRSHGNEPDPPASQRRRQDTVWRIPTISHILYNKPVSFKGQGGSSCLYWKQRWRGNRGRRISEKFWTWSRVSSQVLRLSQSTSVHSTVVLVEKVQRTTVSVESVPGCSHIRGTQTPRPLRFDNVVGCKSYIFKQLLKRQKTKG